MSRVMTSLPKRGMPNLADTGAGGTDHRLTSINRNRGWTEGILPSAALPANGTAIVPNNRHHQAPPRFACCRGQSDKPKSI